VNIPEYATFKDVIPAKAGIQLFEDFLDAGSGPA
jgi:hypothetical protein